MNNGSYKVFWRICLAASAVMLIPVVAHLLLYVSAASNRELNLWNEKLVQKLEQSKANPPEGMSQDEWENIVGWTQVAIPNCLYHPDYIVDWERYDAFRKRFLTTPSGKIDIETIEWTWEELSSISKNGRQYSERFRPIPPIGTEQK